MNKLDLQTCSQKGAHSYVGDLLYTHNERRESKWYTTKKSPKYQKKGNNGRTEEQKYYKTYRK